MAHSMPPLLYGELVACLSTNGSLFRSSPESVRSDTSALMAALLGIYPSDAKRSRIDRKGDQVDTDGIFSDWKRIQRESNPLFEDSIFRYHGRRSER